jgi:8-amino-7-oxononanoate synthase
MFSRRLQELYRQGLNRVVKDRSSAQGARIYLDGRELINFGSNDYLGLANHPALVEAAAASMKEFGFGSGASRLLGGGSSLHGRLERAVAQLKGTDTALIFNSGYAANTGIIPSIAGQGDVILSDELNHASIVDGCRLSRAETMIYRHRDMGHLSELLRKEDGKRKIILTDTVFSMDGDIAPLTAIHNLCSSFNNSRPPSHALLLYIDDAHGTGVLGKGRGALAHFGLSPKPWILQMGTFSKALGSFGAFVAGSSDTIAWILNTARSFFFSTALPACVVAASARAIELMAQDPELIDRLWKNRDRLVARLKEKGVDISNSETPIIPLKARSSEDALRFSQYLYEKGIYAPAIRPPTVKDPRVRITVTAAHSEEDIAALVEALGNYTHS